VNTAPEHGNRGRRVEYTIGWPVDERTVAGIGQLIARRTPRPANKPAKLGEHPDWEYGAFVTNTPGGASHRAAAAARKGDASSTPASATARSCPARTCRWSSGSTADPAA
jgi:hypothetical protein